jgi:hypothetical protein
MVQTDREWLRRVDCRPSPSRGERLSRADSGRSPDHDRSAQVDPELPSMTAPAQGQFDREAAIHSRSSPAYASSSSNAFASLRSGVSKPSVNQP